MSTPVRIAAFVLGLVAVFAVAGGVGRAVGPIDVATPAHSPEGHATETRAEDEAHAGAHAPTGMTATPTAGVGGLLARQDGFTLSLSSPQATSGPRVPLAFTIRTSSGRPLLDYETVHEKDLHLIVVRRDLTGFQHVHPVLDRRAGEWTTALRLAPGAWRVIADFTPQGWDPVTLAEDLFVPGDFRPVPTATDRRTDAVGEYDVSLSADTAPGVPTVVSLTLERDGRPVTDLEPYLGASGHLVAIRAGDLGYLHVHPEEGPSGPRIDFATTFPTPGVYRLFLDFKHQGVVRTADFAVVAGGAPGAGTGSGTGHGPEEGGHDH